VECLGCVRALTLVLGDPFLFCQCFVFKHHLGCQECLFSSNDVHKYRRKRHRFNIDHKNARKLSAYYRDLYHTLLNLPTWRFLMLFVGSYVLMVSIVCHKESLLSTIAIPSHQRLVVFLQYLVYAMFYMSQPKQCVSNVQKFTHALWFSVHTAATIGYGHQSPNPDCIPVNLAILAQVLTGALMQAALLGLVFARFASPSTCGATIKFSSVMVNYEGQDGYRHIAFRVANLRKHQVLRPKITMLLIRKVGDEFSDLSHDYTYKELKVDNLTGHNGLWLGIPSIISHIVDESSPLFGLHEDDMREREMEFVILLDGIDEMTSTAMQARYSYSPDDIVWNSIFMGILTRGESGILTADYLCFDTTRTAAETATSRSITADMESGEENIQSPFVENRTKLKVNFQGV